MNSVFRTISLLICSISISFCLDAQSEESSKKVSLSGSIQSDILVPNADPQIGANSYSEWMLTNSYLDLRLQSKYLTAGGRFEYLQHPLPGFEPDFAGYGVPNFYLTANFKSLKITLGDFYEQFGSGLILRTYEERSLGIDNSIRGTRLLFQPIKGITMKLLGGQQRRYFEHNDSYLWGGSLEFNFEEWNKKLRESNSSFSLETSFISKHEGDEWIELTGTGNRLNLPKNVAAFDVCSRYQVGKYNFTAEYALKGNDPSNDNGYIYKNGSALLLSGSYSQKGFSALLQAKRSDNMSYRSVRSGTGISSFINNLPAFTLQQTYSLAAMYPYATQPGGEWAFQGGVGYQFKKGSTLGGKNGANVKLNISHIRSIDKSYANSDSTSIIGTDGYSSKFFKMGEETYYQDINLVFEKKLSKDLKINLMYMNQIYNKWVIEKHIEPGEEKIVRSNIFVLETKYHINSKLTLRNELQYLTTKQDKGDWIFGLAELSLLPSFIFTVSDMYNIGVTDLHYYSAMVTYNYKAHRINLGYARTRAGYNCSGGVCRTVPASKGVQISYNYNF